MAAKRRHWKAKGGRFWARLAVPEALQEQFGKSELLEPLGGDLRVADRNHPAAVARLRQRIDVALATAAADPTKLGREPVSRPISEADRVEASAEHYANLLRGDDAKRSNYPTGEQMKAEYDRVLAKIDAGLIDGGTDPFGMINSYTELELMVRARADDANLRSRRQSALRSSYASGDDSRIATAVNSFLLKKVLQARPGSSEWRELANGLMRAEIEALQRTIERDTGDFGGQPRDPILRPEAAVPVLETVQLNQLFDAYIASRKIVGKHMDGARRWQSVIEDLTGFLKHSDARRITKRNLIDWRDSLLGSNKSAKTVADVYLACVRSLLKWAFDNDRLPTNEAASVRQAVPKKVMLRERGYTTLEAIRVLQASISYRPVASKNASNQERKPVSDAKRWIPLLCAVTGARVVEMAQLRKEDVRQEGSHWVVRITPEAGSVKAGEYRDVPLHRQSVSLGFIDFVDAANPGPLFHNARVPGQYLANARVTSGRLSDWLNKSGLVPDGVAPSHGWRHRFKTIGRELGLSDRVIDAIQGHAGRTAGDGYGDVNILAKARVIDAFPDYDLSGAPPD